MDTPIVEASFVVALITDTSITEASLLALFLETLLYGLFLTLYLISLSILLTKAGIQRHLLIPVVTLLLCIATAHVVIGFVQVLEALKFEVQTISTDGTYNPLPLELAKMALYVIQTALADTVIVWRCYVVNYRSLWIAIPGCIALLINVATGCLAVLSLFNPSFSIPFYALTMIISATCTSVMAWRIYRTPSFMTGGSRPLLPVFIVIIETGALYAMSVLALLIISLTQFSGRYIILDIIIPIVGISFCLVILQVHFQIGGKFGNSPTEHPAEPRDITSNLFRARGRRTMVLTTGRITAETEIETETEMI